MCVGVCVRERENVCVPSAVWMNTRILCVCQREKERKGTKKKYI